jgi:F0F1-type ATP synthase epsilon subunit
MGFWDRFKRKPKEESATMGMQGQPVEIISGPALHPDHYDQERNEARIAQLEAAIKQWQESEETNPAMVEHLKAELVRHKKIQEVFHAVRRHNLWRG